MRALHGESALSASESDADLSATEGSGPGLRINVPTSGAADPMPGRASQDGGTAPAGGGGAGGGCDSGLGSPCSGGSSFAEDAAATLRELRNLDPSGYQSGSAGSGSPRSGSASPAAPGDATATAAGSAAAAALAAQEAAEAEEWARVAAGMRAEAEARLQKAHSARLSAASPRASAEERGSVGEGSDPASGRGSYGDQQPNRSASQMEVAPGSPSALGVATSHGGRQPSRLAPPGDRQPSSSALPVEASVAAAVVAVSDEAPLRPLWEAASMSDGRVYYYHTQTRETTWERPTADEADTDADETETAGGSGSASDGLPAAGQHAGTGSGADDTGSAHAEAASFAATERSQVQHQHQHQSATSAAVLDSAAAVQSTTQPQQQSPHAQPSASVAVQHSTAGSSAASHEEFGEEIRDRTEEPASPSTPRAASSARDRERVESAAPTTPRAASSASDRERVETPHTGARPTATAIASHERTGSRSAATAAAVAVDVSTGAAAGLTGRPDRHRVASAGSRLDHASDRELDYELGSRSDSRLGSRSESRLDSRVGSGSDSKIESGLDSGFGLDSEIDRDSRFSGSDSGFDGFDLVLEPSADSTLDSAPSTPVFARVAISGSSADSRGAASTRAGT